MTGLKDNLDIIGTLLFLFYAVAMWFFILTNPKSITIANVASMVNFYGLVIGIKLCTKD